VTQAYNNEIKSLSSKALQDAEKQAASTVIDLAALSRVAHKAERGTGAFTEDRVAGGVRRPNSADDTSGPCSPPSEAIEDAAGEPSTAAVMLEALRE
jgi:hypothetical protein